MLSIIHVAIIIMFSALCRPHVSERKTGYPMGGDLVCINNVQFDCKKKRFTEHADYL